MSYKYKICPTIRAYIYIYIYIHDLRASDESYEFFIAWLYAGSSLCISEGNKSVERRKWSEDARGSADGYARVT